MKTRITISLIAVILWGYLARSLFTPIMDVAKPKVAIATLNGGDAAYVAQQALDETVKTGDLIYSLALAALLLAIWIPILKKWWDTDPIINSAA